jgi:hypothetical protein
MHFVHFALNAVRGLRFSGSNPPATLAEEKEKPQLAEMGRATYVPIYSYRIFLELADVLG